MSFRFTDCGCRRPLAVDSGSETFRGHVRHTPLMRRPGARRRGAAGPSLGTAAIDLEGLYSGSRIEFGQLLGGVDAVLGVDGVIDGNRPESLGRGAPVEFG